MPPAPTTSPCLQALPSCEAPQYEAFIASGRRVYRLEVPRPAGASAFSGGQGKEGVYIAETAPGAVAAAPLDAVQHRAEIQHLGLFEDTASRTAVLASADCYGRAILAHAQRFGGGEGDAGAGGSGLQITAVHQLQPPDLLRWVQLGSSRPVP